MPRIAAYHPEIYVQKKSGELFVIKPDLVDWASEGEVIAMLAASCPGCGTLGGLVTAIERGELSKAASEVLAVRIEKVDDSPQAAVARCWEDPI